MKPSQSFQLFKGQEDICRAFSDGRGKNFLAVTHLGDHTSPPLGHAVDFGNFDIQSLAQSHPSHHFAGQNGSLASNTNDENVFVSLESATGITFAFLIDCYCLPGANLGAHPTAGT